MISICIIPFFHYFGTVKKNFGSCFKILGNEIESEVGHQFEYLVRTLYTTLLQNSPNCNI